MNKRQIKKRLDGYFDSITVSKGIFTVKRHYIWGRERTGEDEAKRVRDYIPTAKVIAFGNSEKDKYFYVKFKFEELI